MPNVLKKLVLQSQSHEKKHADVVLCLLHLQYCLMFVKGGIESKIKNNAALNPALKHTSLKGAMTSSICKALL